MKNKVILKILTILFITTLFSCYQESKTVDPGEIVDTVGGTPAGSTNVTARLLSPLDGATGVDEDSNIIITFSELVTNAEVVANLQINGGAIAYTATAGSNRTFTINPTPTLAYNTAYTITINAALVADSGAPIDQAYTWTFTTITAAADTGDGSAIAPVVVAGSQYPANGATGVSVNLGYIEATFSKDIAAIANNTQVTINNGATFNGGAAIETGNTWRSTINGQLAYNTTYTVDYQGTIQDADTNNLNEDGQDTWTFTTETAPAGAPPTVAATSIPESWPALTDRNSSDVYFVTDRQLDIATAGEECFIEYGTATGVYGAPIQEANWDGGATTQIVHRYSLTGLLPSTTYYYRMFVDINDNSSYDGGEPVSAEYTFVTDSAIAESGNDQNIIKKHQFADGSAYLFWIDSGDIYCQYFNTAGIPQLGSGGSMVADKATNFTDFDLIPYETGSDIILLARDGSNLNAYIIDNTGTPSGNSQTNIITDATAAYSGCFIRSVNRFFVAYVDDTSNFVIGRLFRSFDMFNFGQEIAMTTNNIIDNSGAFSSVKTATSNSNLIVYITYGDGNDVVGKSIYIDTTNNDMLLRLYETALGFNSFGWAATSLNDLQASTNEDSCYVLMNNGTGDYGVLKLSETTMTSSASDNIITSAGNETFASSGSYTGAYWGLYNILVSTGGLYNGTGFVTTAYYNMLADHTNYSTTTTGLGTVSPISATSFLTNNGISLTLTDGGGGAINLNDNWTVDILRDSNVFAWSTEINYANAVRNMTMLIDDAGAAENVILTYERTDGQYYIAAQRLSGATGINNLAEFEVTAMAAAYNCVFPSITFADMDTGIPSGWFVSWYDERIGAGDYQIRSAEFNNAGAEQWNIYVYDTAEVAPAAGNLISVYNTGLGLTPIWVEPNADDDIYFEVIDTSGNY